MQEKLISIIIPVFNSEEYLEKCLSSVLQQTYENFEVILIDDASTDGSPEICSQYALIDNRIKLIRHEINNGIGLTRQEAINKSSGEYILFVDSDDYIAPTLIEECFRVMVEKGVDVVNFAYSRFYSSIEYQNIIPKWYGGVSREDENFEEFLFGTSPVLWDKMFKKSVLHNIHFFDINYGEDLIILLQAYANAISYYSMDKIFYYYRQRENSLSTNNNYLKYFELVESLLEFKILAKNFKYGDIFIDYIEQATFLTYQKIFFERFDKLLNKTVRKEFYSKLRKFSQEYYNRSHSSYNIFWAIHTVSKKRIVSVLHKLKWQSGFCFPFLFDITNKLSPHVKRILKFSKKIMDNYRKKSSGDFSLLYWSDVVNLGDTLSPVITSWMLNKRNLDYNSTLKSSYRNYKRISTVGSVIGLDYEPTIIWGSGILSDERLATIAPSLRKCNLEIRAVRGPLTAITLRKLGFRCPYIYGDPAILMPLIYQPLTTITKKYRISMVLHHESIDEIPDNIHTISILTNNYEFFINEILASELIISSSLHGIILAETYGVPAIWLNRENWRQSFKFLDWYYSTERTNILSISSLQEIEFVTPMPLPNLEQMQKDLLDSFPYDIFEKSSD